MTRILKTGLAAAVTIALAGIALAQAPPEMPKPGKEMTDHKWMIGKWNVSETHEKSPWNPNGGTGKGVMTVVEGPGGFSHIVSYESKGPMGAYSGRGRMAWNDSSKVYQSTWADNATPGMMMSTCVAEGKDLVCKGDAEFQGQKFQTRTRAMDPKPSGWTEVFEHSTDGTNWMKVMTLEYKPAK
jgi:hypothetical protein